MSTQTKVERIQALLNDPLNVDLVNKLIAKDATYVSLNFDNPELKAIMPWTGTGTGPQAVLDTYRQVGHYWKNEGLKITDFVETSDKVAVFGTFTYRSVTLGKAITSPFVIFAKFDGEQVVYMQFMEDTFGTASTFRLGGRWTFHSNPEGKIIEL